MLKSLILTTLFVVLLAAVSCQQGRNVQAPLSELPPPIEVRHIELRKVDFNGVSFEYDAAILGEVKPEIVPAHSLEWPSDKPDGVAPEHVLFTFELGREYQKAQLAVYPLRGFPEAYKVKKSSVDSIKTEIEELRRVLEDPTYRFDGEIPHLPYADAMQEFQAHVQPLSFQSGKGVIFVMHWGNELNLLSNRNLIYRYEGISSDGRYYVTGEMPINVPFLPQDPPEEFEGFRVYDESGYTEQALTDEKFAAYRKSISDRIEALPPDRFSPELKHFENLIASLLILKK